MIDIISLIIVIMFISYGSIEAIGMIARFAGYKSSVYSFAIVLANQVYSLNRFNGFLIPPLLGLYIDLGGTVSGIKQIAIIGLLGVAFFLAILSWRMDAVSNIFVSALKEFEAHGRIGLRGWATALKLFDPSMKSRFWINRKYWLIFAQSFTSLLALSSVFIVNILSLRIPEFQSTILQSATLFSGVGNLVLNFYIFPTLAKAERNKDGEAFYLSAMFGKVLGCGVFSICLILLV